MKKTKSLAQRIIAFVLVIISVSSIVSLGVFNASAINFLKVDTTRSITQNATFAKLLESGISAGAKAGVTAALTPMISIIGQEILGLPSETGLPEIMARLDEIESKLDDIKAELSEGFDKVLSELDKREKMESTIKALAEAEFLASMIMNYKNTENLPKTTADLKDLSGAEQKKLIEINADAIKYETVNELYTQLKKAKEYLAGTGFIDSNYESAYDVYYSYMKKQSIFCGEASLKSEYFWELMKESYARSCIALLYALEQQQSMYELMESEPTDVIKQEAIDAAAVATTFGKKSVIENNITKVKSDGKEVLTSYSEFIEEVKSEATVFINKGTCYIKLKPQLASESFYNIKDYETFTKEESFEKAGITQEIYYRALEDIKIYNYNNGYHSIDLETVSYGEFTTNIGKCTRWNYYSDAFGPSSTKSTEDWSTHSQYIFANVMLNLKATKYNIANKPSASTVQTILDYVKENYPTKTIEKYLRDVGFSFGDESIDISGMYYITADNILLGNGTGLDVSAKAPIYDLTDLKKEEKGSFKDTFGFKDPAGILYYFENENPTVTIKIVTDGMDWRIDEGIFTITGKEIVDYYPDGTPEYIPYEQVLKVDGTTVEYVRLPESVDFKTVTVKIGYNGWCASDNHESLCSYSLAGLSEAPKEITLKTVGYTKWWGGYGVDASIYRDGTCVATGEG